MARLCAQLVITDQDDEDTLVVIRAAPLERINHSAQLEDTENPDVSSLNANQTLLLETGKNSTDCFRAQAKL